MQPNRRSFVRRLRKNPVALRWTGFPPLACWSWPLAIICTLSPAILGGQDAVDFGRDIRPILSDKCFQCHGPDAQARQSGLRLDLKENALQEADTGAIPIVPGDPDNSELVRRIMAQGDEHMPPASTEKRLNPTETELLKRWIKEGAIWSEHWAFVAPQQKSPPGVLSPDAVSNPIDNFVMARLESDGKAFSPPASRETLIRRVTLDLTGLPPTLVEIDAYLNDESESAYEKVVDRLLASPHYGEQMASTWLDVARYADSNGYQNDFGRDMWPWRDWVIAAFNDDQPFDEFTVEQIAGDLLPNPTDSQIIATGFNRNHRSVTEGGSIEEEWRVENVIDRVETTATAFLGLTMGCARCHDHKFDPISQREFYQFYAYFNSIDEKGFHAEKRGNVPPLMKVHSASHRSRLSDVETELERLTTEIKRTEQDLESNKPEWLAEFAKPLSGSAPQTAVLTVATGRDTDPTIAPGQVTHTELGKGAAFNRKNQKHLVLENPFEFLGDQPFSVSVWVYPRKNGAIISRMDQANDYRGFDMLINDAGRLDVHLIHQWPTNAIKITTQSSLPFDRWTHVCLTYDGGGKPAGINVFFNQQPAPQDVLSDSLNGTTATDHPTWVGLRGATPPFSGHIARLHVFNSELSPEHRQVLFTAPLRRLAAIPPEAQNEEQKQLIETAYRASFGKSYAAQKNELAALKLKKSSIEQDTPTTMILKELAQPRETFVLNRGQYDQPDKQQSVEPGIAHFLPQPAETLPKNRLTLARWLVDSRNPLTARVAVNRFWQHYFGSGLVSTPENFGVQSPAPLQQDLLDWLAINFIESGWDVKAFQKLIVMSATYRQDSAASPADFNADPTNRNLARGPRFRLSSEAIRDNALTASGLLATTIGGPSVKPYQPAGLWKELAGGASQGPYIQDKDDGLYRRSLYIYRKRTVPPPSMTTFDAGGREICQVARARTNTPLQALALLNDTTYVEAARQLAERAVGRFDDPVKQITFAFRVATARRPTENEVSILQRAFERNETVFRQSPGLADELLAVGETKFDPTANKPELAALTLVCSMILNLDETITKE